MNILFRGISSISRIYCGTYAAWGRNEASLFLSEITVRDAGEADPRRAINKFDVLGYLRLSSIIEIVLLIQNLNSSCLTLSINLTPIDPIA